MSSEPQLEIGSVPPSKDKSKEEKKPRGIVGKKSSVVKILPPEISSSISQKLDTLIPVFQPFQGLSTSLPITVAEEKEAAKDQTNPLLHPDKKIVKKVKEKKQSLLQPITSSSSSSRTAPTPLKHVKKTLNFKKHDRSDLLDDDTMEILDGISPIFKKYIKQQDKTESKNPYLTSLSIYTPQTRRSFYRFVESSYGPEFTIPLKPKGRIDENACDKIEQSKRSGVIEAFSYQKFISEYLRNASPYRGILVYHGLGFGKTCSSIAAAEALYGTANKKIIVMTPASLRPNFMSEISFCGFRHFNVNNHWIKQSLISEDGVTYLYAQEIMSLPKQYLDRVLRRSEEERQVIWIPYFDKPSNFYDDTQISEQDRQDIREQITAMIDARITFINYNGIRVEQLKEYACNPDEDGKYFFDDAVVVIDEVHNLVRLMQGNIIPFITQRKGRQREVDVETIVPGRWKPLQCTPKLRTYMPAQQQQNEQELKLGKKPRKPKSYTRGYMLYRLLSDARNSKIIGLSGTPIINFPEELGILSNILGGYIECVEFNVSTTDDVVLNAIKVILEVEERIDIIRYQKRDRYTEFLVSTFPEGYEKDLSEDLDEFVGVKYNEDAQEGIRDIYTRLKSEINTQATILNEKFVSYPRLPVDDESFRKEFINPQDLSITNSLVLKKRLTGLISYYNASNDAYMPRVVKDEIVQCEMSDFVLSKYSTARITEIKGEATKEKNPDDMFAMVEMFAKLKNPSSYRFRSRALCNFAFPESIPRPFPEDEKEILATADEESAMDEDLFGAEYSDDPERDKEEAKKIQEEEEAQIAQENQQDDDQNREEQGDEKENIPKQESNPIKGGNEDIYDIEEGDIEYIDNDSENNEDEEDNDSENNEDEEDNDSENNEDEEDDEDENNEDEEDVEDEDYGNELEGGMNGDSDNEAPLPVAPVKRTRPVVKTGSKPSMASLRATLSESDDKPVAAAKPASSIVKASNISDSKKIVPSSAIVKASDANSISAVAKPASAPSVPRKKPVASVLPSVEKQEEIKSAPSIIKAKDVATVAAEPVKSVTETKPVPRKKPVAKELAPVAPVAAEASTSVTEAKPVVRKRPVAKELVPVVPVVDESKAAEEKQREEIRSKAEIIPEKRRLTYSELIKLAMDELNNKRDLYLKLDSPNEEGRLATYSTKMDLMIRNMIESKGSNMVYSQFKTVEGLGVLGLALKANGFVEIKIMGSDQDPYFSEETEKSLRKGPGAKEKRFILFTGEGSRERKGLILNVFNGSLEKLPGRLKKVLEDSGYGKDKNIRGDICWVIGITGAGAEGISLKCCRSVHIMEPYWNNVRLNQVKGRAVRICSHTDLPFAEREVEIYTYYSVFSEKQKKADLDITIRTTDKSETSDEIVFNISMKKDKINNSLLDIMKEAAVDCELNSADNETIQCFRVDGRPDQYLFDPDLQVDKILTEMEFKEETRKKVVKREDVLEKAEKESGEIVPASRLSKKKERTEQVKGRMIRHTDKRTGIVRELVIIPSAKDRLRYEAYDPKDVQFRTRLANVDIDPVTLKITRISYL
jgi:hypothetical protein